MRYAVILQADDLPLSTVLVAPTSRSAPERSFRPTVLINGNETRVLVEQTTAIALERLGERVGNLTWTELADVDDALRLALELD